MGFCNRMDFPKLQRIQPDSRNNVPDFIAIFHISTSLASPPPNKAAPAAYSGTVAQGGVAMPESSFFHLLGSGFRSGRVKMEAARRAPVATVRLGVFHQPLNPTIRAAQPHKEGFVHRAVTAHAATPSAGWGAGTGAG